MERIEKEGNLLVFTKKNVSGEKKTEINLSHITKISAHKKIFSYCLNIDSNEGNSLNFGGLDEKAVENLRLSLGSLVEIHSASSGKTITLEEARKESKKILQNLGEDFDGRSVISYLITQAVKLDSSDIHITPRKESAIVQYRIDGLLQEVSSMKVEDFERILATLKNRSKLPSYKKSVPLDGSFHFDENSLNLDVRCATIPTLFGEKAVMRILNTDKTPLLLEELGFSTKMLEDYKRLITGPQGCIVLTGPAGSGKSTTIFASLIHNYNLQGGKVNIATLEDPVEYIIEEFQQTQVNPAAGLTFSEGLRSLLRLDPDIIMVGEIRDPETAHMAMRTALTGHLIFTTVHSRDSIGVFPRLIEMDIKSGLVSSAVTAVLYQRLIRKLCPHCKIEIEADKNILKNMKNPGNFYTSIGCNHCSGTKYSGRTGIFELLTVDETICDMITKNTPYREIYDYCREKNMKFLRENALEKISSGITDLEEIIRVCPGI
jgi:type II secretory ATPase GspE/PulE/Tfp pilus assembly ATPase PilB-like protein